MMPLSELSYSQSPVGKPHIHKFDLNGVDADKCQEKSASSKKNHNRRRWSIQGSPQNILKRMRSVLAEDGCYESQVKLAKALLQDEDPKTREESHRVAVYWLMQASYQGSTEATHTLENCYKQNIGVNEENYWDVRQCLNIEMQQKLARSAAFSLFASISEGQNVIVSCKLSTALNQQECPDSDKSKVPTFCYEDSSQILQEEFSQAGLDFSQGKLPSVPLKCLRNHRCTSWWRCLPLLSACGQITEQYLIFWSSLPLSGQYLPVSIFLAMFLMSCFAVTGVLNGDITVHFIACTCILVITSTSCRVALHNKRSRLFMLWGQLLGTHSSELDVKLCFRRFQVQFWQPFISYLLSVILLLCLAPNLQQAFNFIVSLTSLIFFILTSFYLNCFSSLINVLCLLSTLLVISVAAFNTDEYCWVLSDEWTEYLGSTYSLNICTGILIHIFWAFVIVIIICKDFCQLYYLSICAGLGVLSLNTFPLSYLENGLFYKVGSISLLCLFLVPLWKQIVKFVGPPLLFSLILLNLGYPPWIALVSIAVFMCVLITLKKWPLLFVVIGLFAFLVFYSHRGELYVDRESFLPWNQYQKSHLAVHDNKVPYVINEVMHTGYHVNWTGTVSSVDAVLHGNWMLKMLPLVLYEFLACDSEEAVRRCTVDVLQGNVDLVKCISFDHLYRNPCFLHKCIDTPCYELAVTMPSSGWSLGSRMKETVRLRAAGWINDFAVSLRPGDSIQFMGIIDGETVSSHATFIWVYYAQCLNCENVVVYKPKLSLWFYDFYDCFYIWFDMLPNLWYQKMW